MGINGTDFDLQLRFRRRWPIVRWFTKDSWKKTFKQSADII